MQNFVLAAVRLYQSALSPYFKGYCRHVPSCSEYTLGAVERHGTVEGIWLGCKRLVRCRPFGTYGYDPIP